MSLERRQEQVNGSYYITNMVREVLRRANGARAIGNGINMYPMAESADHFLTSGLYLDGMAAEHVAAFESRDPVTGKLNITRVALEMELIGKVAVSTEEYKDAAAPPCLSWSTSVSASQSPTPPPHTPVCP
jgi:hypothetical protein